MESTDFIKCTELLENPSVLKYVKSFNPSFRTWVLTVLVNIGKHGGKILVDLQGDKKVFLVKDSETTLLSEPRIDELASFVLSLDNIFEIGSEDINVCDNDLSTVFRKEYFGCDVVFAGEMTHIISPDTPLGGNLDIDGDTIKILGKVTGKANLIYGTYPATSKGINNIKISKGFKIMTMSQSERIAKKLGE